MSIKSIGQSIVSIPRKIKEYAQPRPNTSGDSFVPSPMGGAISGGIQGFIGGGPVTGIAGAIGGFTGTLVDMGRVAGPNGTTGVSVNQDTGRTLKAVGVGSVTGAAVGVAAVVGLAAVLGGPITIPAIAASGILGGFAGATGTLSATRRGSAKDGVYGGFIAGMTASAVAGNSALLLATTTAAGMGGYAVKTPGRVVLGALTGAATGAISGSLGGPVTVAVGAAAGAIAGAVGAVIGPPIRQVIRNAVEDLSNAIVKKLDPFLEKHPLGKKSKITLGAVSGAIGLATMGFIFGPAAFAIGGAVGAALGAFGTSKELKSREKQKAMMEQQAKAQAQAQQPQAEQNKPETKEVKS